MRQLNSVPLHSLLLLVLHLTSPLHLMGVLCRASWSHRPLVSLGLLKGTGVQIFSETLSPVLTGQASTLLLNLDWFSQYTLVPSDLSSRSNSMCSSMTQHSSSLIIISPVFSTFEWSSNSACILQSLFVVPTIIFYALIYQTQFHVVHVCPHKIALFHICKD